MEDSENYDDMRKAFRVDTGNRRFRATVYMNNLKITGEAVLTMDTRSTSRRASDFLRHFPTDYMTLSQVQVYDRDLDALIDEPDYIIVNVKKIDALYAKELENIQPGHEGEPPPAGPST